MDLLIIIGIILLIGWAVGFFAFPAIGAIIHVVLVIAIVLFVIRLLRRGTNAI